MNRTFKVVFNKARGSMIVANEATSSVQKKGTKLLVAMAVASVLSCSSAFAADYSPESGNVGYAEATANQALVFEGTEVLNISATGADTQVYGLLATGENSFYTNEGTINLNLASGENAAKFWKTKGMMADNNGTAVNEGTINVTNAYGMTVGSSGETNTITNNGTINVDGQGAAMEVAPTGVSETTGTAKGVANNNGTINVNSKDAYGIIVAGQNGEINQNGTLNAADGAAAILVQEESGKETSGNTIVFGESSKTYGLINIQSGTSETDKDPVTGTTLEFKQGSVFDGRILASGASTTIKGVLGISGQQNASNGAGAAIFIGNTSSSLTLEDSVFADNTITGTDVYGGAIYSYGQTKLKDVTFAGNSIVSTDVNPDNVNNGGIAQGAGGGAVMLKGNKGTVFEDVVFTNNSATATKSETTGGYAYGGALMVDYSTGAVTGDPRPSDVTFRVTKNLVYSGNTVSSDSTGDNFNTYGYHLPHALAGGFLFLDRGSKATFEIAENATLTIGSQVTEDDTDGIASSIPDTFTETDAAKKPVNDGKHAEIVKSGLGDLIVNGTLNKYYGTVDVQAGTMTVNSHWNIKNEVTVQSGATLVLNDFAFVDVNDENNPNQDKDGNKIGGSLTVNGTLQTISSMAFEDTSAETLKLSSTMNQVTFAGDNAAVALADETYTLDHAQKAGTAFEGKNVEVVMLGSLEGTDGSVTLADVSNISGQTVLNSVTIDAEDKNVQIGGDEPQDENVAYRADDLSVGAIDLGTAKQLTIAGTATLKLSGVDGNLVSSSSEDGVEVNVNDTATLVLGGAAAQGGTLNATVTLADGAQMNVTGNADYVVAAVTGAGTVNVGEATSAGRLTVNSTEGFTGTFFADPAWKTEGGNTVDEASQLAITDVSGEIGYKVAAGQNSVVSLGAEFSEATAAFNAIAEGNGLSLGDRDDQISAVLYIGEKITLGTTGGILVDGTLTNVPTDETIGTNLTVKANGMLIADQSAVSGDEVLVTGTVKFDSNSYLGLSNAVEGEFQLASSVTGSAQVVTDNPFISGSLGTDGTVTTKTDVDSGLKSIESLGLQAMIRRADSVLAATIADRTSFGQQLKPGLNLWVDVAGENYQADHFDKGGEFEADMGYGTFGADVAVGNFTLGGALQYGTGTLRSSVSGIKNSIDNYGVSLYGTYSVTDNFKLGAELAYVWGENDITADQTALNQSVDTEMYSAGVRAMYEMKAGNFRFVPSIGLRVSQLSTDEMKVGAVKIEDQDQTLVQLPIAMRITAADYSTASGWTLSPSFKLAYVPTFGDKDIEVLNTAEDVIDTSPVQADFGLMAGKDNMLFNVNFMLGAGEYGSSAVGGKVGFKYAF